MAKYIFILSLWVTCLSLNAQDRTLRQIRAGEYDKAFDNLIPRYQKTPKDLTVNYLLSKLYAIPEFKSYDPELAYDHLQIAKSAFEALGENEQSRLSDFPITLQIIQNDAADINKKSYENLQKLKDHRKCHQFILKHTDAGDYLRLATQLRDRFALEQAEKINTSNAYADIIRLYPDASNIPLWRIRHDKLKYEEETASGTLESYIKFVRNNPFSGFVAAAEDKIFELSTANKSLLEYELFAQRHPNNRNVGKAYDAIYATANWDDGEYGTIQRFFMKYPDFPKDHPGLSKDIELAELAWELGLTERIAVSPFGNLSQKASANDELNRRLKEVGAKTGDIQISLMWNGYNDLDLHCEEPGGELIWFRKRGSATGGELDVDMNASYGGLKSADSEKLDKTEASDRQPVIQEGVKYYEKRSSLSPCENIYWPGGNAPSGKYNIYVNFFNNYNYDEKMEGKTVEHCPDTVAYTVRLRIGDEHRDFTGSLVWDGKREKQLVYSFYFFRPGINRNLPENYEERLDYFIQNAAHKELAYVALQRKIKDFVENEKWHTAAEIVEKTQPLFKQNEERYNRIGQLLNLLKTGKTGYKPENLGIAVNTKGEEYSPVISADNLTLFFCGRNRSDNLGNEDIFISDISLGDAIITNSGDTLFDTLGTFQQARIFPFINTKQGNEAPLSISVDGNTLLLFSGGNIYYSEKTESGWTSQQKFPYPINTDYWEGDAMLTADGKAILFVFTRPGGYNLNTEQGFYHGDYAYPSDIYISFKEKNGWSKPVNLGPNINTMYCERSPFLHPDMKTLYFSSDGHYGFGQLDVFKSTLQTEGDYTSWSKPVNLGKSVNTGGPDWGYKISTYGLHAYFSKENGEYKEDLYRVLLPEDMRPNPVVAVSGKVTDTEGNPLDAALLWEDLETATAIGNLRSNPENGRYFIVLPAGKLYGYFAEKADYYPVSNNIDIRDVKQFRTITEDIVLVSIEEMKRLKTAVRINNIFFDLDKWVLRTESYPELDRLAVILEKILKNDPATKIEIMGHTCNSGSDSHNQKLSENRAKAVYEYLISKNIPAGNLISNGYGKHKPVESNNTEAGRQKNRRVEFRFAE